MAELFSNFQYIDERKNKSLQENSWAVTINFSGLLISGKLFAPFLGYLQEDW